MAEGSHISEIYQRLRSADDYHPYSVNTFGDWSTESGDMITISRDGRSYTVPVGESTTTWRGRAQTEYSATGDEERSPISKISKKKFSGGGGGMSQSERLWRFEVNQEHLLYDVYDPEGGLYAFLEMTVHGLRLMFQGMYDGLVGLLEMTRSRLRIEFWGLYDGLFSSLEFTRSRLRVEFLGLYDGLSSSLELTRSHFQLQFTGLYDGLFSSLELTRSRFQVQIQDNYNALNSYITQTASSISLSVRDNYNALNSSLVQTASSIRQAVHDNYESLHASITLTSSSLTTQINNNYSGLSSRITQTASSLTSTINNNYTGLSSRITQTASSLTSTINSNYNGLSSRLTQTASSLSTTVGQVTALRTDVNSITGSQLWQDKDKIAQFVGTFERKAIYKRDAYGNIIYVDGKPVVDHYQITMEEGATLRTTREGIFAEVVDKGNVVSSINVSAEAVTIRSAKVDLGNYATVGKLEALEGKFNTLTGGAGHVNGMTIDGLIAPTAIIDGQRCTWQNKYVITNVREDATYIGGERVVVGVSATGSTIYYLGK